jgi:hypothetical protein
MVSLSIVLAAFLAAHTAQPTEADLTGYGRVRLEVQRGTECGTARFTCEDALRADRLLSKLRADLTWDQLLGPRTQRTPGLAPLLLLSSGALGLVRQEQCVYAVVGPTAAAVESGVERLGLDPKKRRFLPERRHPLALDFYDLRSVSMYHMALNVLRLARGLQRYDRATLARPADFWGRFGMGYSQFSPYFGYEQLADGPPHCFTLDYATRLATARDQVFMTHAGMYQTPWWMRNRFPADIVGWDPYAITGWNGLGAMAGAHLSQWASDEAYAYAQRFTRTILDRLQADAGERLGCFRVAGGGHPGDEMGLHHLSTEFMDYDPAGQAAFRRWLQQERGLDLGGLGERWYGDRRRFRTWDEVRIPSQFEFFGRFGRDTLDLLQAWQWRPDSPQAEAQGWHRTAYEPDDDWTPTDLAPSMQQLFLFGSARDKQLRAGQSTKAWLRKEFDPAAWLARHGGAEVYLVAHVGERHTQPIEVFFNEAYLGRIRPRGVSCGPIALRLTSLIRPGRNVLCLKVPAGLVRGPVFLTTQEPRRYPYLGRTENARWIDLRDWTAAKLIDGWRREARLGRQQLPDVPLLFCPGGCLAYSDQFLGLRRELGIASVHFTGGGANYMPWWAGMGYVWGAHMSSEEGGTVAEPDVLSRELAYLLLAGAGHHNYYYGAIDYMDIEQRTGWFTKHRRLLELMGKATWQPPAVAVLRAARTDRYFPHADPPHAADLGFGPLQAAHVPNVYVTEAELQAGLADAYSVVFDAGTSVFDDRLLAAIERYVRGGGTFVAVQNTGRHSLLEPDTWPITRLSGWRVRGVHDAGQVTVARDWGGPLAGHTFTSLEGLVLECKTPDAQSQVLARWDDGSPAAVARRLGRGRIVVLGTPFWRNTNERSVDGLTLPDSIQTTFLRQFGGTDQAQINSEDLWVRRFTTKNGLQQWVMLFHAGRAPLGDLTLTFPLAQRPPRVVDIVTGKPVAFTFDAGRPGTVRVEHLDFEPGTLRVLGVDQPDGLEAIEHWFAGKRRYDARPVAPQPARLLPAPPATAVVIEQFQFRPAPADAPDNQAWLTESTAGWKTVGYGFWDEQGFPARGVGLYRTRFDVPASWSGRRVMLACASHDTPVFLEHARLLINGRPVGEYQAHAWANFDVLEITDQVRPGKNTLAVRVEAREVRGGYLGQVAIYAWEPLAEVRELRSGWRLYADNREFRPAELPLTAVGRHLETDVTLPAAWKGRQVFLEFEVAHQWVGCVVINGRPLMFNQAAHPYGNLMQVNLAPWARPGQLNRIELWPRTPEETARLKMVVRAVRIGVQATPAPAVVEVAGLPLPPVSNVSPRRAKPAPAATVTPAPSVNLLVNGGFEGWQALDANSVQRPQVRNVQLTPAGQSPLGWTPGREPSKNTQPTGTIALDEQVHHGGRRSVRLENRDMRDITYVQYSTEQGDAAHRLQPNRRYALRWWVKAEQVDARGTGPMMMMYTVSAHAGKTWRTNEAEPSPLPKGTFDWQRRELVFVTDAHTQFAVFNLQLRWATGTAWYDDIELVDLGPAVQVETY